MYENFRPKYGIFKRCLIFTIFAANKEFKLVAGKLVPLCNQTFMRVSLRIVTQKFNILTKCNRNNYVTERV